MGRAVRDSDPRSPSAAVTFEGTPLSGVFVIHPDRFDDERGFFARTFCSREFEAQGLNPLVAQCNTSGNRLRGTIRGLHWQEAPHTEVKLVRCTMGALYDVIVDLRPDSPTFKQWYGVELNPRNGDLLYIPEGFAHGYQTLEDHTEVSYQMSTLYAPGFARGARYDDPAFGIVWPLPVSMIAERDRTYPDYSG